MTPVDACAGVVPSSLPASIRIANPPIDRTPFQDGVIGDAAGAMFFTTLFATPPDDYSLFTYNQGGMLSGTGAGQFADSSHPRVLPQAQGFMLLDGRAGIAVRLNKYSALGAVESSSGVLGSDHLSLATAADPSGGALVVFYDGISGAQQTASVPWQVLTQRFDEHAHSRGSQAFIASDPIGSVAVGNIAGAVSLTGWTFALWTTFVPGGSNQASIHGAWVSADGTVSAQIELGIASADAFVDVEPLVAGGVAVAITSASFPATYNWVARIRDGVTVPDSPDWLAAHPFSRLGLIRGKKAYAVLRGAPFWPEAFTQQTCEAQMDIPLIGADGTTCGTVSLPIPPDASLRCTASTNDAALAKDGTVVVETSETGTDADGNARTSVFATLWPRLLQ